MLLVLPAAVGCAGSEFEQIDRDVDSLSGRNSSLLPGSERQAAPARAGAEAADVADATCPAPETPVIGAFSNIHDPSADAWWPWYINDHTIVRGPDGLWHLFGITHAEPANPENEVDLAHATSESLVAPNWEQHEPALSADPRYGELVLWAPYVMQHDGLYYMFYSGGGFDRSQFRIELATSPDLWQWTRESEPLFFDGFGARDPFVIRLGDRWVMYYTATSEPEFGAHIVAYRTSSDLRTWSERQIAYTDRAIGSEAGPTESPYVVQRGDDYYLFIGPRDRYNATTVLHSRDPLHFEDPQVTELPAHAAEIVTDLDGQQYFTRAGWGEGGVWLAPLRWQDNHCQLLSTAVHRLAVRTEPNPGLASLRLAGSDRELLGVGFDVPGPFLRVADSPQPIKPGAPRTVEQSPDGSRLTMRGMRMGDQPVEVDWAICASKDGFDHRIRWHVLGDADVIEAGWSLSLTTNTIGDADWPDLAGEYPSGFGAYTFATDERASVAIAYRPNSSFAAAFRDYQPGFVAFHHLPWSGTERWQRGDYEGGIYRVAVSTEGHDERLPDRTVSALRESGEACPL